jgi:hypothetical protein
MMILPNGQIIFSAHSATVSLYTPSGAPDPVWVPTITACPSSVRRNHTYTLSGRQINGLNQGSYYGNDATNATNYPIVRLQSSTASTVYYCRTSNYSTMGLQTGTAVHSCSFTVPSWVPLGAYYIVVIANGIASAGRAISVTNKLFKELKWEIKDKAEVVENFKELIDTKIKRVPDLDIKINEGLEFIKQFEEQWVQTVRSVAAGIDAANAELSRTFIGPKERPFVGIPEPVVEELVVPKISAAEARRGQEKRAFADGRDELVMSKEFEAVHEAIHNLWRSGGKEVVLERRARSVRKAASARRRDRRRR